MKKYLCLLLALLFLFPAGCRKTDSSSSSVDSETAVKTELPIKERLQKGVNVEGSMLNTDALTNPDSWMYEKEIYKQIAEKGFDHIRIPTNFSHYLKEGTTDFTIDPAFFDGLDKVVNYALDAGLIAVIDFHGWSKLNDGGEEAANELYRYWEQTAEHYKDYPEELLFELLNEPTTGGEFLNTVSLKTVEIIRRTNPTRTIALPVNECNGVWNMWKTQWPENDENIILSVHSYAPMDFTHQGAWWTENRTHCDYTDSVKAAFTSEIEDIAYYEERTGRKAWLSEWGTCHGLATDEEIAQYATDFTKACRDNGVSYCYWELANSFKVYDLIRGTWLDYLLKSLQ